MNATMGVGFADVEPNRTRHAIVELEKLGADSQRCTCGWHASAEMRAGTGTAGIR